MSEKIAAGLGVTHSYTGADAKTLERQRIRIKIFFMVILVVLFAFLTNSL